MNIKLDTTDLKKFSQQLKSLSKTAMPVAVRQTLNDAAYDVKENSMPKKAGATFKKRQPNFFIANSKVVQATGLKVDLMSSEVGFFSNSLKGNNNRAVKDLEQQEKGGSIDKKDFIPETGARSGETNLGLVKPNRRLRKLPRLTDKVAMTSNYGFFKGKMKRLKSKKQSFIRAAFLAKKRFGGFVLGNKNKNGNRTLSIISSITSNGDSVEIKRTALYNVRNNRKVKVDATKFMERASYESGLKMNEMFIKNAQARFIKHLKK